MEKFSLIRYNVEAIDPCNSYTDGTDDCVCPLCPEFHLSGDTRRESALLHATSLLHEKRYGETNKVAKAYMERSLQVHKLLITCQEFGCAPEQFRSHIVAYLFQEPNAISLEQLEGQIHRLRWKIVLSLLELALWKSACILNPPILITGVSNVLFWVAGDAWKELKPKMRRHELVTVVMENVIPFLDQPTE
jgi:hypothetical protein